MRIIGGIIAILIAVWFYRSAESKGVEPFPWAFAGAIFYYIPMGLWTFIINPLLKNPHVTSSGPSMLAGLGPTMAGVVVAVLVHQFVLLKVKPQKDPGADE